MDKWVFVEMIWIGGQFELKVDGTTQGSVTFNGKCTILPVAMLFMNISNVVAYSYNVIKERLKH